MKTIIAAVTILIASALAPIHQVQAQVSLVGVEGIWIDVEGGENVNGLGTNQINWGITNGQQSGYIFAPASQFYPVDVTLGENFDLATFTHNNFVIGRNTSIQGATLATNFTFLVDGQQVQVSRVYDFFHIETFNSEPGCCDDYVFALNNTPFIESAIIGGYEYFFDIEGIRVDGELFSVFQTVEDQENVGILEAKVTRIAIPEPSTYLLLSSMLVVAFVARRRVRKFMIGKKIKN